MRKSAVPTIAELRRDVLVQAMIDQIIETKNNSNINLALGRLFKAFKDDLPDKFISQKQFAQDISIGHNIDVEFALFYLLHCHSCWQDYCEIVEQLSYHDLKDLLSSKGPLKKPEEKTKTIEVKVPPKKKPDKHFTEALAKFNA